MIEYKILGAFNVHEKTSLGFWQVSNSNLSVTEQLLDCHDFLLDCQDHGLCIYKGTELCAFCEDIIQFMNNNDVSPDDLKYYDKPILGFEPDDYEQIIDEEIDYTVPHYCDGLVSNPELAFGRNPGGGCLGFWTSEGV